MFNKIKLYGNLQVPPKLKEIQINLAYLVYTHVCNMYVITVSRKQKSKICDGEHRSLSPTNLNKLICRAEDIIKA